MTLEIIMDKFCHEIDKFLNRIKINHVVCVGPVHEDGQKYGQPLTENECDEFLKASPYNKLSIKACFLLNDHNNAEIKLQSDEDEKLNEALEACAQFLSTEIAAFSKHGENQYELNALLKQTILYIDAIISRMNYSVWLDENFDGDEVFYVLINKKKICKRGIEIDIQTWVMPFINMEFEFRRTLLYRLKIFLVDIYSNYLLLPEIESNPKISYECSTTDICELLSALSFYSKIKDSEKLKAVLMGMFGISGEVFRKTLHEIRSRPSGEKGKFLEKLADELNRTLESKTKSKTGKQ